jgi:uncharacterized Zn finger protein
MSYYGFPPYVSVAQRRAQAAREIEKLRKKGRTIAPVVIEGRTIARNFWGKAWCENLERYSDFENRLPRGKIYARNGSVVDLQVERGQIQALVMGSSLYKVKIDIGATPAGHWRAIRKDCVGSVGSLVELLSGKLSKNVVERVCRQGDGLFPAPREIKMSCSCPDGARMCKHVAAALYGAGTRLDATPDLLFVLRGVDVSELIASAGADLPIARGGAGTRILADDDLAALFGVEMAPAPTTPKADDVKKKARRTKNPAPSKVSVAGRAGASSQTAAKTSLTKGSMIVSSAGARKKSPLKAGTTKSGGGRAVVEKIEPSGKTIQAKTAAPGRPAASTSASDRQDETPSPRRVRTRAARWIKRP